MLDRSVPVTARDVVLLLVNDDEYGGSCGAFAVASTNSFSTELMLHELGHSFGLLADEYTDGPCDNSVEPPEVNVTRASTAASIKWAYWIEPGTPVPSTDTMLGVVSAYEGARYCESGLYRPTFSSKMRDLERPFEQVNTEQLIGRIYNLVSPIDAVSPATAELQSESDRCEPLDFSVTVPGVPDGLPATIEATWSLDGDVVASGNSLNVLSCALTVGVHRIELEVRDVTKAVRNDPAEMLVERFQWNLAVTVGNSRPGAPFTDDPIRPGVTTVKAIHFRELRDRIDSLRNAAGRAAPIWTDASPRAGTTPIRAGHLMELRAAVVALE